MRAAYVLCHADGALFCNYSPKDGELTHAIYFVDEDAAIDSQEELPDPAELGLAPDEFRWFRVVSMVVEPVESGRRQVMGHYDDDSGEFV